MDEQPKGTILPGYRVLDLTDDKGMFCPRLLADMGAEVIRVARPGAPAPSAFHQAANRGKRAITLDIESQRGQELLGRLVGTADVLVESYAPGYLGSLGLGYPQLSKANPRLVMASITGFGQAGPHRDHKSYDIIASATGGHMSVCGEPGLPLKPAGNQSYYLASLFAAIGVMLALWRRHTSGRGQHIDISLQECVAATLDHVLVRYFYEGTVARRQGSLHGDNAFRVFPCRDGHILLSLLYQWETLLEWLGAEGMAEDLNEAKWRDREFRRQHIDHIIEVLERWTKSHRVSELVAPGQLMRFPWAEVASIPQLLASPQLEARHFWMEIEHQGKKLKLPATPLHAPDER